MAWNVVMFSRLYYKVNGGEEKVWDGLHDLPRLVGTQVQLDAIGGTNNSWTTSASRGNNQDLFFEIAALNGGSGHNFWQEVHGMPNNGIILIYRESGNDNLSFAIQKTSGGMRFGYKLGSSYTWSPGTNWGVFAIDSEGAERPGLIHDSSINYAIITDGTRYSLCEVDLGGQQYPNVSDDTNYYSLRCGALGNEVSNVLTYLLVGRIPVPSEDPYAPGGTSEPGGGGGNYDDESDAVSVPGLPSLNLSINGFVTAYSPTLTQLNDLADFIWSDWLSGGPTLPKIFASPESAIISLHMLPFTPSTSSAIEVTVGHYASGVSMDPMTQQFYVINCGSLTIDEYWGNYLDYNPYLKLTLFLPYVGEITLNPDEVVTHEITVKYHVDAMTGAFVCFIIRDDDKILGEYQGNCSLQVPISSANYAQLHSALLGLAGSAITSGAQAVTGGVSGLLDGGAGVLKSAAGVMDSKIRHSHSGALGSASGFMGSQRPYLIIERARQCLPRDLNKFAGYPSQITSSLGDLTGFVSVSEIVLDGIPLTDGELAELRGILEGGIYL